jgi:hypothetical protein
MHPIVLLHTLHHALGTQLPLPVALPMQSARVLPAWENESVHLGQYFAFSWRYLPYRMVAHSRFLIYSTFITMADHLDFFVLDLHKTRFN